MTTSHHRDVARPWIGSDGPTTTRRDVLLGASLVGGFALIVAATAPLLDAGHDVAWRAVIVATALILADLCVLSLPWRRLPTRALIVFPLLLVGGQVALVTTTTGLASNYTGFLTLAFIYVGMTQSLIVVPVLATVVVPVWLACQDAITTATVVRLGTGLTIWLTVGWVLAARTQRDRTKARALIARAKTDQLTGTGTRLMLSDHIDRELHAPQHAASSVIVLDIDGFRNVNELYGPAAGDELLVAVARRLKATVRPDDACARLGGDRFAVLLYGADLANATRTAMRALEALAQPFTLRQTRIAVTASIGVASLELRTTAQEVLRDADLATFEAKAAGRNTFAVFESDMRGRQAARVQLETELRDGVERGEFELYYQPVVHMQTGRTIGTEALLRWNHPQRGLLTPDKFLNASEEIGVIVALGNWILERSCRQAAEWQPTDPARALTMAVNTSAVEFLSADFVPRVREVLAATGLQGNLLVIEITERLLAHDAPAVRKQIDALKRLGVRIAIDDFGTGYSSLAYLREFPIDILKIDRSFVQPLGRDRQATALLRSIVAIAEALQLDIIVEGVETPAQIEILAGLGCEVAQGFHFARPGRAQDIDAHLLTERPSRIRS